MGVTHVYVYEWKQIAFPTEADWKMLMKLGKNEVK